MKKKPVGVSSYMVVCGFVAIAVGAFLLSVPFGLFVAGSLSVLLGLLSAGGAAKK